MKKNYGIFVWLIATFFVVYSFCLNTAAAVFSKALQSTLHANDLEIALAAGAFIFGYAFMQIPAGYLLDKFNARFVVSISVLVLAIGNIAVSFSTNLVMFTVSNLVEGIGASFAFIAAAVLISQWFSAKKFPILFGLTQTLSCILAGIIHYHFTLALTTYSWNDIYRGLAISGFILFGLTLLFVKTPIDYNRSKSISFKKSFLRVFKNKQILLCCLAAGTSFGVLLAYASLWYMPINSYYGVQLLDSVMLSGTIFTGIGIGTPLFGWFSNLIKSRITVIHMTLVTGTIALLLGIYLPHFDTNSLMVTKITSFLIGFLLSGSMLFYTVVSEISTDSDRGIALGLLNTTVFLFNTGLLFIPRIFITTASTEFFTYLWILPSFILISILVLYFIKDTYDH